MKRMQTKLELRQSALALLCRTNAIEKADTVIALGHHRNVSPTTCIVDTNVHLFSTQTLPGIPSKPE